MMDDRDNNGVVVLAYVVCVACALVAMLLLFLGSTDGQTRKPPQAAQLVIRYDDMSLEPPHIADDSQAGWVATLKPLGPAQYVEWIDPNGVVWVGGAYGPSVQCEVKGNDK